MEEKANCHNDGCMIYTLPLCRRYSCSMEKGGWMGRKIRSEAIVRIKKRRCFVGKVGKVMWIHALRRVSRETFVQ